MRKIVLSIFTVLLLCFSLTAQNLRITGTVSDSEGTPMIGVTVVVKDTNVAAVTGTDGKYALSVPSNSTLVFSHLGYESQEVPVAGRTLINVILREDAISVDRVVVTALGISREEKSLGYAVSSVSAEELETARESNILNSLSGKVAGVNIMQNSGTAGGGSKIILRGQSSLGSSGQPLFVVDGLPISNGTYDYGINGSIDTGSRVGDIASDDIETLNVLKGAAATALYGARAKDGVIVITTKKGKQNQPTFVSVNSSVRFDSPLKMPDYQNSYGPGNITTSEYSMDNWNGWGPKMEGQNVPVFTGETVALQADPDNVRNFFNTGTTYTNNISLQGGDAQNDFRVGISSLNQTGIVPNNKYDRYNFSVNAGRKFNSWMSARVTASYIRASSEGRPAQGSNDRNATAIGNIMTMPRNIKTEWLRDNWITEEGKPYPIGGGSIATTTNNPYWILNKNKYTGELDRFMGTVSLELKPIKNLTITNNFGTDFFYDNQRRVWAKYTFGVPKGRFHTVQWNSSTINNDLIATYDWNINDDFNLTFMLGHNALQITNKTTTVDAQDLLNADIYTYANAETTNPTNTYNQRRLIGVLGEVSLSYKNMAYLSITGRNDWSSTMPKSHRSYFYPSISGSFVFTELIPQNNILSFGKIRANYAMVGSDTAPYALNLLYGPSNGVFLQFFGQTDGKIPHGSYLGYTVPGTFPSPELEPQMQKAFEVGLDLRFFNNRVRLDATYYHTLTDKNIAAFDVANSTGFFYWRRNAGLIKNEGVEIMLGVTPVKTAFVWDMTINFASNKQTVVKLAEGMSEYSLTSGYNGLQIKAAEGEAFQIYGKAWVRDDQGNIVIGDDGLRKVTGTTQKLGKINPDFTMGIMNSFSWKGIGLSFLIDIRKGGVMYSQTAADMKATGVGKETLLNDRQDIVDIGVVELEGGGYAPNTKAISAYDYWTRNFKSENTEGQIYDASYVKLREVVVGYTFPQSLLKNFPLKDIFIGFEARNLWIIDSKVPHIDPELNFFSTGDVGYGVEFGGIPTTRSLGFNIKFKF